MELQENKTLFKSALRKYLCTHVLYSVEEFLIHNTNFYHFTTSIVVHILYIFVYMHFYVLLL
jgi:hypothetical protein